MGEMHFANLDSSVDRGIVSLGLSVGNWWELNCSQRIIAGYYDDRAADLDKVHASKPIKKQTQMLLRPQFWRGQQHGTVGGSKVHARHMRPLCERISSSE